MSPEEILFCLAQKKGWPLNKPNDLLKIVSPTARPKWSSLAQIQSSFSFPIIPIIKHGGGVVIIWALFATMEL